MSVKEAAISMPFLNASYQHALVQVEASKTYAVIAPNMGKQIVAFQVRIQLEVLLEVLLGHPFSDHPISGWQYAWPVHE